MNNNCLQDKMNDRDKAAITRIRQTFSVTATLIEKGICFEFAGIPEKFNLFTEKDEFIVFTDMWHEHFDNIDEVMTFFDGLFTGRIQIEVKFRGKTPVGHQVQLLKDGKVDIMSQTGSIVPLFWRPKSYKTLKFITANKSI